MAGVITIDGPGGSGKGTLARLIASALGFHLLDSGAIYRVLALAALENGVQIQDTRALCALSRKIDLNFPYTTCVTKIQLNGTEISGAIRSQSVADVASKIAMHQPVRDALMKLQRRQVRAPGLVADGRDLGTIVFPDAELKIFLKASAEVRAERRYKELIEAGHVVERSAILCDLEIRDVRDCTRTVAPLVAAEDAYVIDNSFKTPAEVLAEVHELCQIKNLA